MLTTVRRAHRSGVRCVDDLLFALMFALMSPRVFDVRVHLMAICAAVRAALAVFAVAH